MTFEQLRVFVAVCDQNSFTRAAELLYLSQPAVSQHIQGLERHFQLTLIERRGKRLELTVAGAQLLHHARKILKEASDASDRLADLGTTVHGKIRVGSGETVASYLLPEIMGRFLARYPQIQLSLRMKNEPDLVSSLTNGEVDIAFIEEEPAPKYLDRLMTTFYATSEVVLIVRPDHPWAQLGEVEPSKLFEVPLVLRQAADRTRMFWEAKLASLGVPADQLQIAFELDNTEGIKRAVMAGLGAGFVADYAVDRELRTGELRTVRLTGADLSRSLWVVLTARERLPEHLRAFLGLLVRDPI